MSMESEKKTEQRAREKRKKRFHPYITHAIERYKMRVVREREMERKKRMSVQLRCVCVLAARKNIDRNGAAKAFETCLINFIRCHILFFDKSTPCRAISKVVLSTFGCLSRFFYSSLYFCKAFTNRILSCLVPRCRLHRCFFTFSHLTIQWLRTENVVATKCLAFRIYQWWNNIVIVLFGYMSVCYCLFWSWIKELTFTLEFNIFSTFFFSLPHFRSLTCCR